MQALIYIRYLYVNATYLTAYLQFFDKYPITPDIFAAFLIHSLGS